MAYFSHLYALILTLVDSNETMDDWIEKLTRVITIFKFLVLGPIYLLCSIPLDSYILFINMYTKAWDADDEVDEGIYKDSLNTLIESCNFVLVDAKKTGQTQANYKVLCKELRGRLEVFKHIEALVYENNKEDKFIRDKNTH